MYVNLSNVSKLQHAIPFVYYSPIIIHLQIHVPVQVMYSCILFSLLPFFINIINFLSHQLLSCFLVTDLTSCTYCLHIKDGFRNIAIYIYSVTLCTGGQLAFNLHQRASKEIQSDTTVMHHNHEILKQHCTII